MSYPPQQNPLPDPGWQLPPTPPSNPKGTAKGCGFALLGLAVIICIAISGGNGDTNTTASNDNSRPAPISTVDDPVLDTTVPAAPVTTAPAALVTTQRVSDWASNGGADLSTTLSADLGNIGTDSSTADLTATGDDCVQLSLDTDQARRYGPIPDKAAQLTWSAALTDYHNAAADCIVGTGTQSVTYLRKAINEMQAGTAMIVKTTARMYELAGT